MTREHRTELWVGITVIAAFLILIGVIIWARGALPTTASRQLSIHFDRVGGLDTGDPVTLSGVEIGRVTSINLMADSVRVRVQLDRQIRLRRGAEAVLITAELMGGKRIELINGSGETRLSPDVPIQGKYIPGLTEIVGLFESYQSNVGQILDDLQATLEGLRGLLGTSSEPGTLRSTIRRIAHSAARMDSMLQLNITALQNTVDNVEMSTSVIRRFLEDEEGRIREMLYATDSLVTDLRTLTDSSARVVSKMNSDSTSLGRVLQDDSLYRQVGGVLRRFDSLMVDFQTNPGRYFENVKVKISPF